MATVTLIPGAMSFHRYIWGWVLHVNSAVVIVPVVIIVAAAIWYWRRKKGKPE